MVEDRGNVKITSILELFNTKPDRLESSREYFDRLKGYGSGLNPEFLSVHFILNCRNEKLKTRREDRTDWQGFSSWKENKQTFKANTNNNNYNNNSSNNNNNGSSNNNNGSSNNNNSYYNNFKKTEMIQTPYNLRPRNKINFINDIMIDLQVNNYDFSFMIDTGSPVSSLPMKEFEKLTKDEVVNTKEIGDRVNFLTFYNPLSLRIGIG
ncbi:glycosyltransferase-like protein gnt13 [Gordionus sp. m RMFG-2023]|uniref:glycosyltransferase-like protein gnt13 n=1 Tax=Gordionus sp. m RMFG-2023 TaxID=3053472 RepID=UPI0031FD7E18